jgi:membrane protein YdbS with pleckstrin-like domain
VDEAPARASEADWQRLDVRKIDLDREVGWVVTAVLSIACLTALGVASLSDDLPRWLWWTVAFLWGPFTVAIALLSYRWPPIEFRYSRYRIDEQLIEIERGVLFRESVAIPRSRVQHLDVSQGPMMRRHGLGQLAIYTAGTEYSQVTLAGLSYEIAQSLRDRLLPREVPADGV